MDVINRVYGTLVCVRELYVPHVENHVDVWKLLLGTPVHDISVDLFVTCPPGDPSDPGTRAGLGAAGADVRVQTNEAAAPEAADGAGEQAEGGDGRAPAEAGQRAGEPEEQLLHRGRQTGEEAPGHPGEGGETSAARLLHQ